MDIINTLRKLGVLRWGATSGVYRNAAERPIELQDSGVFDASCDLISGASGSASRDRRPTSLGKVLGIILTVAAVVALVLFLIGRANGEARILQQAASSRFSAETVAALRERAVTAIELPATTPDGWSKSRVDPLKLLTVFDSLRLREGFTWRAYQFKEDGNANGIVWAMPMDAAFPSPDECPRLESHLMKAPKPLDALDDAMEIVEGNDTAAAYLQASILRRELRDFGAAWHGINWGAHHVVDQDPSRNPVDAAERDPLKTPSTEPGDWKWSQARPDDWKPRVDLYPDRVVVTFYTYSGYETERLYKHVDTYRRGKFRPRVEEAVIAVGRPGWLF